MIVAEDVTSRSLNVIGLFNGSVPLIAIQLQAVRVDDKVGLIFTTVLDELPLGMPEGTEESYEPKDRSYWEDKATEQTVGLADRMLEMIQSFATGYELKYNKYYIGLAKNGQPNNFTQFKPQKKALRLELNLRQTDPTSRRLEEADIAVLGYDRHFRCYNISLSAEDVETHRDLLTALMKEAHDARAN